MISLIVATIGRPTLVDAIVSAVQRLPVAEVIIAPAPDVVIPDVPVSADVRLVRPTFGLYEAWNVAVTAANGPLICFLNDDDVYEGSAIDQALLQSADVFSLCLKLDGRSTRASVSARLANGRLNPVDLFHANRAGNINSYIWPKDLLFRIGPFDETYRISGDVEWMQRLVGLDLNVKWLSGLSYVQRRGEGRLSSWGENQSRLVEEAERVVESVRRHHGRFSSVALLGEAWIGTMRLRRAATRASWLISQ